MRRRRRRRSPPREPAGSVGLTIDAGQYVQTVAPTLILTIALFMALVQLKIATQIVVATYVLVLGAVALGFALAFGLGGREVAGQMLISAYQTGQQKLPQVKAEMSQAKDQAASDADKIKQVQANNE